jgi:hypothetical protein
MWAAVHDYDCLNKDVNSIEQWQLKTGEDLQIWDAQYHIICKYYTKKIMIEYNVTKGFHEKEGIPDCSWEGKFVCLLLTFNKP